MPKYAVVGPLGPECLDYGVIEGGTPLHALRNIHVEADVRCCIRDGQLVFADLRDQELCAGRWRIVECGRNGREGRRVEITIPPPIPTAA
jgi:hypothetical protein